MKNTRTLTHCTVLTVDEQDHFYPDGAIVIEEGRIKAVGPADTTEPIGEVVDMQGALVLPGLINTHTHSHSSIFRGQADDLPLMDWLQKAMWPMEAHLNAQRSAAATRLSCLEYLKAGITTYADQFYFAETTAKAASESGLRCFLAATVFEKPSPETDDTLGAAADFVRNWRGREEQTRIHPCIGPHAPYSVSARQFRAVLDLSEKYDLLIHTHISETADENRQIKEKTGLSPTAWLDSLGLFSRPVLAAHSIHLSEADMDIYAARGVRASYNPVSNMKLASGVLPLEGLRRRGVCISLGTDGAQSNNTMDLLRDLRTGLLLQKLQGGAGFVTAREGVRLATIEGARALRMEGELGSLQPGKRADLTCLDPESERLTPLHRDDLDNLYAAVCYAACGADVRDVMVEGEFLMRERRVLTLNEEAVRAEAQQASRYLVEHAAQN